MSGAALGPRHRQVKRLRLLLRNPRARFVEGVVVLEGARVVDEALRRAVALEALYLGAEAGDPGAELAARARAGGAAVLALKEGVGAVVGTTRSPQPVFGIAARPAPRETGGLARSGPVLVVVGVSDPGNLGTLLRSAEAAGSAGVVCCGDTVDVANPKVVRASAGAIFGVPVVEAGDPMEVLEALGAQDRRCFGAVASGGRAYVDVDLTGPVAFVVGNEARGLPSAVSAALDAALTIPMAARAESLNVSVAGSVLLFEAARQRSAGDAR